MKRFAIVLLGMLAAPLAMAGNAPTAPKDFAFGVPISTPVPAALYELTLPQAVYEAVTRDDLGDVSVFNAKGEAVPHAVRAARETVMPTTTTELPWYPLYGQAEQLRDVVSLNFRRDRQGTVVQMHGEAKSGTTKAPLAGYLLDASQVQRPLAKLTLSWDAGASYDLNTHVRVEASDDLVHWRDTGADAALVRLRQGSYVMEQRTIALPATHAKYLLLRPADAGVDLAVHGVEAELAPEVAPPERDWKTVTGVRDAKKPEAIDYDIGGRMPVDRVRVLLPETNVVVSVEIYSRGAKDAPWVKRTGGLVYRLQTASGEVVQTELELPRAIHSERYLRVILTDGGAVAGRALPNISVGWIPQRLVFVAQGKGPFELAYGSSTVEPAQYSVDRLLAQLRGKGDKDMKPEPATTGSPHALGGTALLVPEKKLPWKRWILWGVLVIGVALLVWMATRLYGQMNKG
ncbi:MAG: DUF3999 domain-containing protein [Acidiferrobacteraceae bacterium]